MLIPGAFLVVSFVFGFFLSIVTLVYYVIIYSYKTLERFNWQLAFKDMLAVLKKSAIRRFVRYFEFIIMTLLIRVIIHLYEMLVQLDWQLDFQTLSGYVLAVSKMATACVSVVFHCFEFIITQFMTLLITLVSIIWKIASFVFILSWHITLKIVETLGHVFNFFVSNATLMIRSVSHVTIRSYETLVQLDWQLAFQTLGGFVLAVFKMAATCVSVVVRCFEFIITQFMTLLITLVSIIWKIVSFIFIHIWHITVKIVETFVSLVVGISELISAVIDSTMSSNPLNIITVIFFTVSIVIVSLLLMKRSKR